MITITLDKDAYLAGEVIRATITVKTGKPKKARALYAKLVCNERRRVKVSRTMDKYDYDRDNEIGLVKSTHLETAIEERSGELFSQEKKVAGDGTYSEGTYEAEFALPDDAAPTSYEFGHDDKIHIWKLYVKLDVPFALDENAEKEVFVGGL